MAYLVFRINKTSLDIPSSNSLLSQLEGKIMLTSLAALLTDISYVCWKYVMLRSCTNQVNIKVSSAESKASLMNSFCPDYALVAFLQGEVNQYLTDIQFELNLKCLEKDEVVWLVHEIISSSIILKQLSTFPTIVANSLFVVKHCLLAVFQGEWSHQKRFRECHAGPPQRLCHTCHKLRFFWVTSHIVLLYLFLSRTIDVK